MSNSASLDALLRRLIDTPPDFLDPPRRGREGQLQVAAVVNDATFVGYVPSLLLVFWSFDD
jgi:hypothetical protein